MSIPERLLKHYETSQDFFKTLYDKEKFTEEVSEQYFDEQAGEFLADRYIVGTCLTVATKMLMVTSVRNVALPFLLPSLSILNLC